MRSCDVTEDPAAVAARKQAQEELEENMKWVWVAVGVCLVGGAMWQFLREVARAQDESQRERKPWEMV
jgi:hypothetical protein